MAVIDKVKELVNASSVCPEAKEAGQRYLDAVGTDGQKKAADDLVAELKEDVRSVDQNIEFFGSPAAAEAMGREQADAFLAHFKEAKAAGKEWCDCPACSAGKAVLDSSEELYR
jgi:hypothetical protein